MVEVIVFGFFPLVIVLGFFALVAVVLSAEPPASAGYGSCYEVRPICMAPQAALCMCDQTNYCFWVCR
jgi:hypothetical protein